jgi:hypothetical protein
MNTNKSEVTPVVADFGPLETRHHSHLLVYLAQANRWKIGAELGLANGRTYSTLLTNCPKLVLIGVDTFKYTPNDIGSDPYKEMDHEHNEKQADIIAEKFKGRALVYKMTTNEAAQFIGDGTLDFVFIDANHSYPFVKSDIMNWTPKVKDSGWVLGHDYAPYWSGVVKAVHETFGIPKKVGSRKTQVGGVVLLPGKVWAIPKSCIDVSKIKL